MTGDPPGLYYHTRLRAIVTPNEPPEIDAASGPPLQRHLPAVRRRFAPALVNALYAGEISLPQLQKVHDFGDGYVLYRFVWEDGE
jgi:hypothetical protein